MTRVTEQDLLVRATARADVLTRDSVVLYAGANLPTAEAQAAYTPALSAYPAMGPSYQKEQPDTDLVSDLEVAVRTGICDLLGANWAEPRLPSCTFANLAVFHAFTRPGDLLLAPAGAHGGHLSQRRGGTPELAGLRVMDLPYDAAALCLDADKAAEMIRAERPAMVLLGRSIMLKPDPIAVVVEAARDVGAVSVFDASHVLGLIMGGTYPNPLAAGVDLLTSSTYKTFPGRPHSVIAGSQPSQGEVLASFIDRQFLANNDSGRLPSLLVSLRDAKGSMAEYARDISDNTRRLGTELRQLGVPVRMAEQGETPTHQLLVPMPDAIAQSAAIQAFAAQRILLGTCSDPARAGGYALRIGTQFVTRHGGAITDWSEIARCIARIYATLVG